METCDVLIVGGGPAGSACATVLKRAGLDVLILDKAAFPRDKPCAGWVTPQVVAALDLDVTAYSHGHVCQPITGFRCGMIGRRNVEVSYDRIVSYGIRRCQFDRYLLDRSGARYRDGQNVTAVERRDSSWIVNGQYSTPMIVGAGGHFCPVARAMGTRNQIGETTVFAQEAEFQISADQSLGLHVRPEVPELYFLPDLSGYGWCFCKGDYVNIGLGRTTPSNLAAQVDAFCGFLREQGRLDGDIPARFHGHAYQLYHAPANRIYDDGALLVGDAASLAYPQSGEGIRPAVESGLFAADVILQAGGRYERCRLSTYQQRVEQRLGSRRPRSTNGRVPAAWLHYAAGSLLALPWFTRHVVVERWFLHAQQEALANRLQLDSTTITRRGAEPAETG